MKLIIGLGNPGIEYENTRHNVGFMALNAIANDKNINFSKIKFDGKYAEININGEKYILLLPQKYMNLSGEVVKKYMDFFKIGIDDILVISDDLDMETGKLKLKFKGSSGGHNGLKNIEQNIGSNAYKRIKVGIANNKQVETSDYVLGNFSKEEQKEISQSIAKIVSIFNDYGKMTFDNLMNKYN